MSEKGERQLGVTIFKTVYNCTIMGLKEVLEEKKLLKIRLRFPSPYSGRRVALFVTIPA